MKKYDVLDEHGRLIESNVNRKRARSTVKANPGSRRRKVRNKNKER